MTLQGCLGADQQMMPWNAGTLLLFPVWLPISVVVEFLFRGHMKDEMIEDDRR